MTKTTRNSVSAIEGSFHTQYAAIWGEERWHNTLYPALAGPTQHAVLINRYAPVHTFFDNASGQGVQLERIVFPEIRRGHDSDAGKMMLCIPKAQDKIFSHEISSLLPPPKLASNSHASQRVTTHYNLDAASALAVHLLDGQSGENVLDLCAAPGGKSIALAQNIWPEYYESRVDSNSLPVQAQAGHLTSNESDPARHKRLLDNLKAYLPAHLFDRKQMSCQRVDGTDPLAAQKLSIGSRGYDKVLVDAPCSSERHIIHAHVAAKAAGRAAPELTSWRSGASKRLVETQVKLLMTGLRSVKLGGNVLYATCSLETAENDGVVEKMLALMEKERRKGTINWGVKIGFSGGEGNEELEAELEMTWAERTKYGWIVLPDHPAGGMWGPLFFVMLTKIMAPMLT